ncbi:helix-turn-helix domain-containing protein [Vreelandella venusta]|uniref:helix-turn-helix domain-containing protein n=1 Tax=Vreelandella venusta TaxID=44935 RepID=UPI004044E136
MARAAGLNRNAITLLYRSTAQRVELDVADKLCKLFSCGVGDLFKFEDDQGK